MHEFIVEHPAKIMKAIPLIESKIKIKISLEGNQIFLKGNELEKFVALNMVKAIDFGFDSEDALLLENPEYNLEFISMKDYTKKNLKPVRARLIGTNGRVKETIQELTGSLIVIKESKVAIIVNSERLEDVTQAIISLIRGSKIANVFAFLEKQNANLKLKDEDLGLKERFKKIQID